MDRDWERLQESRESRPSSPRAQRSVSRPEQRRPDSFPRGTSSRDTEGPERGDDARQRKSIQVRGLYYDIDLSERAILRDLGRFRTVAVEDLATYLYGGRTRSLRRDLGDLRAQGLIQVRSVWTGPRCKPFEVSVLTKTGKEVLEVEPKVDLKARDASSGDRTTRQQLWSGFVKAREIHHDAAVYRMYQAERQRLEALGARVVRVVLDYELKTKVYAPLAKAKHLSPRRYAKLQEEVARENGLQVVSKKIPLPDLRVEYETGDGELGRVDLELATSHYHAPAMAAKAAAGFRFYVADGSAARLSRALEERDITVAILSL